MNNTYIYDTKNDVVLKRVTRDRAKKIWATQGIIYAIPCKANYHYMGESGLFGVWLDRMLLHDSNESEEFETVVNTFIYYNCNRELGYYPAFYVAVCKINFAGKKVRWFDPAAYWEEIDVGYYVRKGLIREA